MTSLLQFRRTFLARMKSEGTTNDGPSSKKEDYFGDMNPPPTKGEQVDDMKLPRKGGVMMRLTLMMDDGDDGVITFICG